MATYCIEQIEGLKESNRRSVMLLSSKDDREVNAAKTFDGLGKKHERDVRSRFDSWIDGMRNNRWFHGWDVDPYRECLVFKWKEKNVHHRLYGFLYHPLPKTNARFELCVLTNAASKTEYETDKAELNKANALRQDDN